VLTSGLRLRQPRCWTGAATTCCWYANVRHALYRLVRRPLWWAGGLPSRRQRRGSQGLGSPVLGDGASLVDLHHHFAGAADRPWPQGTGKGHYRKTM